MSLTESSQNCDREWDGPPPGSYPGSFANPISRPMSASPVYSPTPSQSISSPVPSVPNPPLVQIEENDLLSSNNMTPYTQYNHSRHLSSGIETILSGVTSAYSDSQVQNGQTGVLRSGTLRGPGEPDRRPQSRPHLDRLEVAYYRLYWEPRTPLTSQQPLYSDDPSLSSFNIEHVPPPRLAENYMAYICNREGVHISRVKMYINTRTSSSSAAGEIQLLQRKDRIIRAPGTCGSYESNPYMLTVEMDNGEGGNGNREDAAKPLPVWIQGGRIAASGCLAFLSVLGGLLGCK